MGYEPWSKNSLNSERKRVGVKVFEHGSVDVVRARGSVSGVFINSETELECGDRKVAGERVFGVERDRVSFGVGFEIEKIGIIICVS